MHDMAPYAKHDETTIVLIEVQASTTPASTATGPPTTVLGSNHRHTFLPSVQQIAKECKDRILMCVGLHDIVLRDTNCDSSHIEDKQKSISKTTDLVTEVRAFLELAVPTLIIQMGFAFPPFLTASYVGRFFGPLSLAGFQLSYLTINLFTLSLLAGLFSASDTLSPQAFGAGNFVEVGVIAARGLLISLILIVPIGLVLAFRMPQVLLVLGEDAEASQLAVLWYRLYLAALPFYGVYLSMWKFLSAQKVMWPLVVSSVLSTGIILPVTMHLLVKAYGFAGSALAYGFFQIFQSACLFLILYIYQPYKPECWPGFAEIMKEVFRWDPFVKMLYLGFGGIVASSEWIYWETISLGVGSLGVVPLSVHTIPSQFLTIAFMGAFGIGVSLSIRLGHILPRDVDRAQEIVLGVCVISCLAFGVGSLALYFCRHSIYRIFVAEDDHLVLAGCEEIWGKVCVYFFLVSWFAMNTGVANGLGMQWTLGFLTLLFLWLLGVPGLWYYGLHKNGSLSAVWGCINPPYVFINILLGVAFVRADWNEIAADIRKRERINVREANQGGPFGINYGSV